MIPCSRIILENLLFIFHSLFEIKFCQLYLFSADIAPHYNAINPSSHTSCTVWFGLIKSSSRRPEAIVKNIPQKCIKKIVTHNVL